MIDVFVNSAPNPHPSGCPYCGKLLEAATNVSALAPEPPRPAPGDWSLCSYCGGYCVFGVLGEVLKPTDEVREQMEADESFQFYVEFVRGHIARRKQEGRS